MSSFKIDIAVFNRQVPIRSIMEALGYVGRNDPRTSVYCPFHMDRVGGHKSAMIRDEDNTLYCFSERKVYRPYDFCKLSGRTMESFNSLRKVRKGEASISDDSYGLRREQEEARIINLLRRTVDNEQL